MLCPFIVSDDISEFELADSYGLYGSFYSSPKGKNLNTNKRHTGRFIFLQELIINEADSNVKNCP